MLAERGGCGGSAVVLSGVAGGGWFAWTPPVAAERAVLRRLRGREMLLLLVLLRDELIVGATEALRTRRSSPSPLSIGDRARSIITVVAMIPTFPVDIDEIAIVDDFFFPGHKCINPDVYIVVIVFR